MSFRPRFTYTHAGVRNLGAIEAARAVVKVLPLPHDQALFLRQAARQRATRNSTAIEGNRLNSLEIRKAIVGIAKPQTEMQQEVRNYWRALEWVEEQVERRRRISEEFIREMHCIIAVRGKGRRGDKSNYRLEECPVVDAATNTIDYAPPRPSDVPALMLELVQWLGGSSASDLPGPVRAGLLAHRFVTIHPFNDGNGRTARALATAELWRSGYDMRGFLSLEEYYTSDLNAYYDSLQMGLPVDYYKGRNDPDHTIWLDYFLRTMAQASEALRQQAQELYDSHAREAAPWENLPRVQQQLLTRLMVRGLSEPGRNLHFTPSEIVEWYGISGNAARDWLEKWRSEEFVQAEDPHAQRIRRYILAPKWEAVVREALDKASNNQG